MILAIITLIMSLIGYFGSKKAGASDGEAALVAAGVGAGTYYVGSQTAWGKDLVNGVSRKWESLIGKDDAPLKNSDGSVATAPPGATPVYNKDGSVMKDPNGNVVWKMIDSAGNVLQSWGPAGTAAVIGTTAVATDDDLKKWIPIAGAAVVAILLLK